MESAGDISQELGRQAEAFCRAYFPNGRLAGNYWQVGDTSGAEGGSLNIRLSESYGRKPGKWVDYASGEYGDLLDLIPFATSASSFVEVMNEARSFLGRPEINRVSPSRPSPAIAQADASARAERLFSIGRPVAGTPAEAYLRNRDITRFGDALAYHDAVYYRASRAAPTQAIPAMLAKITDPSGKLTGVARTWLDIERRAVADIPDPKRVMGNLLGNAVRFGAPGPLLAAGEGIETVLSIGSALPGLPVAACLSATHLGLFEVPDDVRELWIVKDQDEAGERAAQLLRQRLEGRDIVIRDRDPVLGDFNDDVGEWGVEGLRDRLISECGASAARCVDGVG
ncbi:MULTISPECIES: DUF7146 domain-containing protein [unclassified Aurantimonas]|uniref:DUF7146 domain-containing protein n=1 Tax=unclassified Aurantimonas TaxID=2638230 RepID=UPI002E1891BB|nr:MULTISPECIES: toprim domain-containing protein [unclassified Aurantimonas]MEC5291908.1 toprim domain-containing protein [Aurantimonas sp. C2-3-R2]MEC5412994.1 toprim domain-containing protein [Aurantimonas sp. C2-4-R8]